jgi:hypothetical protein
MINQYISPYGWVKLHCVNISLFFKYIFIYCWILFPSILLRIFPFIFIQNIGLWFSWFLLAKMNCTNGFHCDISIGVLFFFPWWNWGLKSRLHACKTGALLLGNGILRTTCLGWIQTMILVNPYEWRVRVTRDILYSEHRKRGRALEVMKEVTGQVKSHRETEMLCREK